MSKSVIIIPTRLEAKRLPNKPLLKINNIPIIIHVMKKAKKSGIGDVIIATPDKEISDLVKKNNGKAILTSKNHFTGTDRIYEALNKLSDDIDIVIIHLVSQHIWAPAERARIGSPSLASVTTAIYW